MANWKDEMHAPPHESRDEDGHGESESEGNGETLKGSIWTHAARKKESVQWAEKSVKS